MAILTRSNINLIVLDTSIFALEDFSFSRID